MDICGLGEGGVEVSKWEVRSVIRVSYLVTFFLLGIYCKDWREGVS
jgi:hypothetical protein